MVSHITAPAQGATDSFVASDGEIGLDEMERRLRELWLDGAPRSVLADEDRAIAEKLLGKGGAKRLSQTKRGQRFRYRPELIQRIEYWYYVPPDRDSPMPSGWTIEARQNGRRRELGRRLDDERCGFIVRELQRRNYRVELVITEPMKRLGILGLQVMHLQARPLSKPKMERSKRFAIMEQLRGFQP